MWLMVVFLYNIIVIWVIVHIMLNSEMYSTWICNSTLKRIELLKTLMLLLKYLYISVLWVIGFISGCCQGCSFFFLFSEGLGYASLSSLT